MANTLTQHSKGVGHVRILSMKIKEDLIQKEIKKVYED